MTLEFKKLCKDTQERLQISQGELARRCGMTPENFSAALRGSRPIPAETVIELSEITGENAKQILLAAQRLRNIRGKVADAIMSAALGVVIAVSLFLTPAQETHAASTSYDMAITHDKDYSYSETATVMAQETASIKPNPTLIDNKPRRAYQ